MASEAILGGAIHPGDVIIIRYEGPRGGPGMREMLSPTANIAGMGLGEIRALITDGRFLGRQRAARPSATSPPEAADGEPMPWSARRPDRDRLSRGRTLNLLVEPAELEARRKAHVPPAREIASPLLAALQPPGAKRGPWRALQGRIAPPRRRPICRPPGAPPPRGPMRPLSRKGPAPPRSAPPRFDLARVSGPYWPQSPPGRRVRAQRRRARPRGAPKAPRHQRTRTNAWRAGTAKRGTATGVVRDAHGRLRPGPGARAAGDAWFPPGPGAGTPCWTVGCGPGRVHEAVLGVGLRL
jgi:hypothetical protein